VVTAAAQDGYGLESVVLSVVRSDAFNTRVIEAAP